MRLLAKATILLKTKSRAEEAAGLGTEQIAEQQQTQQSYSRPARPKVLQTGPSTKSMQPCWPYLALLPMVQGDSALHRHSSALLASIQHDAKPAFLFQNVHLRCMQSRKAHVKAHGFPTGAEAWCADSVACKSSVTRSSGISMQPLKPLLQMRQWFMGLTAGRGAAAPPSHHTALSMQKVYHLELCIMQKGLPSKILHQRQQRCRYPPGIISSDPGGRSLPQALQLDLRGCLGDRELSSGPVLTRLLA